MDIQYKIGARLNEWDVANLFLSAGLKRPSDNLERIGRMLAGANLTVTAWDGERLVGIARALTDFAYCCYLSDLAVDGAYQKQGIGRKLVEMVQKEIGEEVMLLLLSVPDAMTYYPKIGFEKVENGWTIPRKK